MCTLGNGYVRCVYPRKLDVYRRNRALLLCECVPSNTRTAKKKSILKLVGVPTVMFRFAPKITNARRPDERTTRNYKNRNNVR